jgi:hypothetical protein
METGDDSFIPISNNADTIALCSSSSLIIDSCESAPPPGAILNLFGNCRDVNGSCGGLLLFLVAAPNFVAVLGDSCSGDGGDRAAESGDFNVALALRFLGECVLSQEADTSKEEDIPRVEEESFTILNGEADDSDIIFPFVIAESLKVV